MEGISSGHRAKTHTLGQGAARADKETSTDGAANSNHVQMPRLHRAVQFDNSPSVVAFLERLAAESAPSPEILLLKRSGELRRSHDAGVGGGGGRGGSDRLDFFAIAAGGCGNMAVRHDVQLATCNLQLEKTGRFFTSKLGHSHQLAIGAGEGDNFDGDPWGFKSTPDRTGIGSDMWARQKRRKERKKKKKNHERRRRVVDPLAAGGGHLLESDEVNKRAQTSCRG